MSQNEDDTDGEEGNIYDELCYRDTAASIETHYNWEEFGRAGRKLLTCGESLRMKGC